MPPEIETEPTTATEQATTRAESPDNDGLLSALRKEREEKAAIQKLLNEKSAKEQELLTQLEKVKAIDPDKYQKLKLANDEREEQDLLMRKEFDKAKKQYLTEAEMARKQASELKNEINNLRTTTAIEKAFFEAGGRKSSFDLTAQGMEDITPVETILSVLQKRIKLEEDGKIVFLNAIGNVEMNSDGRPKSIGEKMIDLKKGSTGVLFEPENTNSGTGATPTVSSNGRQVKVYSVEQARNGRASMDDIASGKAIITR
jgi:hypothetical protein